MTKKIFICAGEASGDMHASNLVKELKNIYQHDIEFYGIGGQRMKEAGVKIYFDLSSLAVLGVWEVLKHYIRFKKIFTFLVNLIERERPDLAILVDYPSFNLRLAEQINKRDIPIAYYISPQIWAWGSGRINLIKRLVKKMVVFFEFEYQMYKKNGVDAEFIGHPLLDSAKPGLPRKDFLRSLDLDDAKLIITLLPGSRKKEVEAILPVMAQTAVLIKGALPTAQFIIAKHPGLSEKLFQKYLDKYQVDFRIVDDRVYDALNISNFAIVKSGTATLETAILGVPMIIVYRTSFLTWLVSKHVIKLPYIGMVNVMANRKIAKEFLQYDAIPKNMANEIVATLRDKQKYDSLKGELNKIKNMLGAPGASKRGANVIAGML